MVFSTTESSTVDDLKTRKNEKTKNAKGWKLPSFCFDQSVINTVKGGLYVTLWLQYHKAL